MDEKELFDYVYEKFSFSGEKNNQSKFEQINRRKTDFFFGLLSNFYDLFNLNEISYNFSHSSEISDDLPIQKLNSIIKNNGADGLDEVAVKDILSDEYDGPCDVVQLYKYLVNIWMLYRLLDKAPSEIIERLDLAAIKIAYDIGLLMPRILTEIYSNRRLLISKLNASDKKNKQSQRIIEAYYKIPVKIRQTNLHRVSTEIYEYLGGKPSISTIKRCLRDNNILVKDNL